MGTPGRPHKSYLQFGREATYGTAVAATHRLPILPSAVTPQIGNFRSEVLGGTRGRSAHYQGPIFYRFNLELELWYAGLLNLVFDGLMGTATYGSNGGSTAGGNPYTHTFLEKDLHNSFTMELIEGDIPTGKCQRLRGCKVDTAVFRGSKGQGYDGVCKVNLGIIAQLYETNQTPTGALSSVAAIPALFHQISTADDGTADAAADIVLSSFEIAVNNHLAERMYQSVNIAEPIAADFMDVTIKLQKELQTKTLLDAVNAFTAGSPTLIFNGTASKSINFTMSNAFITEYSHPIPGSGIIMQDVTWESDKLVGNALDISINNTQATITT